MKAPIPVGELMLLDVVIPPAGTCAWWLMARGWAGFVQLGKVSKTTEKRQAWEFWAILFAAYVVMFGITIYGLLR